MAGRKRYDVTPKGDDWVVQTGGQTVRKYDTKEPAVKDAVERAHAVHDKGGSSQVVIHKQDGRIQEERTYGADPYPPAG